MQYPVAEKIGIPELLVGRVNEFANFNKWLGNELRARQRLRLTNSTEAQTFCTQNGIATAEQIRYTLGES